MPEWAALRNEIAAVIQRGLQPLADHEFNALALRNFRFQFEHNLPYRKYCERRITSVDAVTHWLDVPAVPTAAFKEAVLVTGDSAAAAAVFRTSGTTQGEGKRGAHYVLDLDLYEKSLLPAFRHFVLGNEDRIPMVSLVPAWHSGGDSSLGYMVGALMRQLGTADNWYAIGAQGIEYRKLHDWLTRRANSAEPVCMIGTSLAFVHCFDYLREQRACCRLPAGSRVMDTGGFKGSTRSISSAELRELYSELLGIAPRFVINEYGMTEMLTQFYDGHLQSDQPMFTKLGPPWVRTAVVDADTLRPLPPGETGLLRHFDLANLFSVSAIQTEDLGRAQDGGFELLGRAAGATPRGCSIAMDAFLSAVRK